MKIATFVSCVLSGSLIGCVPYPGMQSVSVQAPATAGETSFGALGPDAADFQSQRFSVSAHGQDAARQASETAEAAYNRLTIDAGLLTFQPANPFKIIVYQDKSEFLKKTGQPSWSRGVIYRGTLYTYQGRRLDRRLAYKITEMVFSAYIGRENPDWDWVKEGLAAYEEVAAVQQEGYQQDFFALVRPQVSQNPIPMDQMLHNEPADDGQISNSPWHCEAESMVSFMITQGGRTGFGQFLAALQSGQSQDSAISQAFSNRWSGSVGFYQAWRQSE